MAIDTDLDGQRDRDCIVGVAVTTKITIGFEGHVSLGSWALALSALKIQPPSLPILPKILPSFAALMHGCPPFLRHIGTWSEGLTLWSFVCMSNRVSPLRAV